MSVDVIIPTFQRPSLTLEALHSVIQQTYSDIHIFIIEDGIFNSTADVTIDHKNSYLYNSYICQKNNTIIHLTNNNNRIHYICLNKNYGPSYCRNLGAKLGKSEYIAFLDSDDLWHSTKIEKQVKYLEENPKFQYIHTNEKWLRQVNNKIPNEFILVKQKKIHHKQGGYFIERLLDRCLISPSSIMFKRNFWNSKVKGFHKKFRVAEDYELWLRLNLFYEVAYIEEPLTIKRAGKWSQLSSTIEMDRQRVLALHRFYRLYKHTSEFKTIQPQWKTAILKKLNLLIKGAVKYNKSYREKEYLFWKQMIELI